MDPRIETETDPKRKLQMFTTHIEVKGRMHFIKSVALLKGKILTESEKRMG